MTALSFMKANQFFHLKNVYKTHNIKTKLKQKVKSILFNQAGRLGWRDLLVYLKSYI